MSESGVWPWVTLVLLGAYQGINPGTGWLFAVALGMQERSRRAVWRSLISIAAGHALAIGIVVFLAAMIGMALPLGGLKIAVAAILFALGAYRLVRRRHPRKGGMQVGFRELTIWSFLMATAHGAGLMVLPVLLHMWPVVHAAGSHEAAHHAHATVMGGNSHRLADPWRSYGGLSDSHGAGCVAGLRKAGFRSLAQSLAKSRSDLVHCSGCDRMPCASHLDDVRLRRRSRRTGSVPDPWPLSNG